MLKRLKDGSPWFFSGTFVAVLLGHMFVDTYSSIVAPLIGVVQTEFGMERKWAALLLGLGSVFSGMAQPAFAWISDRTNTRVFGSLGLVLAAFGICLVGYSPNTQVLFAVYCAGMIGVGMFHPVATAKVGAVAGNNRSLALSLFFLFGMAGFFTGSLIGPALATDGGTLRNLVWLILPGLVMAAILQMYINSPTSDEDTPKRSDRGTLGNYDWKSISLLYLSAVFRFFVNMAMLYLIVRWVEFHVGRQFPDWSASKIADHAAPIAGIANACMFVGQGLSGLVAGALIRSGREKLPLILTPILFAPAIILLAFCGPGIPGFICCFLGGVGFAAMTPITISVGQRMMPRHTRLASGIMLGGGWIFASLGPQFAESVIALNGLWASIVAVGTILTFAGIAASFIVVPPAMFSPSSLPKPVDAPG